jgi:uncharacterized protein (DUF488 family)
MATPATAATFFTVGHSTRTLEDFVEILHEAGVRGIADVRRFPASRRHPHFNRENLEQSLPAAGIEYRHFAVLGGRRGGTRADSPNGWWEIEAFRNYADHALSAEFRRSLDELRGYGAAKPVAVMCAEALWWRCHRRLVTDNLLAAGEAVIHLLGPGKHEAAELSPGARVQADGRILYPPVADQLALRFD